MTPSLAADLLRIGATIAVDCRTGRMRARLRSEDYAPEVWQAIVDAILPALSEAHREGVRRAAAKREARA